MRIWSAVSAVALLSACTSTAKPAPTPPTPPTPPKTALVADSGAGDKKICKRLKAMTSNTTQRICSTRAEWDAYDKQGGESVEQFERARNDGSNR